MCECVFKREVEKEKKKDTGGERKRGRDGGVFCKRREGVERKRERERETS